MVSHKTKLMALAGLLLLQFIVLDNSIKAFFSQARWVG
jgi:hypothetical protein